MIIAVLIGLVVLMIVIGCVLIAEWSFIAVKEFEYEQQNERESRREGSR